MQIKLLANIRFLNYWKYEFSNACESKKSLWIEKNMFQRKDAKNSMDGNLDQVLRKIKKNVGNKIVTCT